MGILKLDKDTPLRNTPKTEDAGGVSIPSSYEIEDMTLYNEFGEKEENFKTIVTSIKLIEEIYSPVIVCKISVLDDQDFFQNFKITGKEVLTLKISKKVKGNSGGLFGEEEHIELGFIVKEYPSYKKSASGIQHQEYDIIFISPFAYFSRLQTISQSVEGNIFEIISELYNTYLGITDDDIIVNKGACPHKIKTVITKRTPLKAITWLLSKAFTGDGYSFYMWQTVNAKLKNKIIIKSWEDILRSDDYVYDSDTKPYVYKKFFEEKPGTLEHTEETLRTIISFSSNLKIDKLEQVVNGGFGNELNVFDYDQRTAIPIEYLPDSGDEKYSFQGLKNLSDNLNISSTRSINAFSKIGNALGGSFGGGAFKSYIEKGSNFVGKKISSVLTGNVFDNKSIAKNTDIFLHKPAPLYENVSPDAYKTTIEIKEEYQQKANFLKASSENISHNCTLYGNFNLNPGYKIRLNIPKLEGGPLRDNDNVDANNIDSELSGNYIITMAIHSFKNGEYTTKLRLVKSLYEGEI